MSALSKRVSSLEESQAVQVKPLPYSTPEEYQQWMDSIEAKLNAAKGKPIVPWAYRPIPPNASPSEAFLHDIMNRMAGQQ